MKTRTRVAAVLIVVSSLYASARSRAQMTSEPVTVVSHVDIIPDAYRAGAQETAGRLFRVESAMSQKDAGLLSYVVLQEKGLANHFTIVEVWHDAHAYELHGGRRTQSNFVGRFSRSLAARSIAACTGSYGN